MELTLSTRADVHAGDQFDKEDRMAVAIVPTRQQVTEILPEKIRSYAGIGPYYMPVFGHVYTRRLYDCLKAVQRHAPNATTILDAGCGLGVATASLAQLYPQAAIYGIDLYPSNVLRYARALLPAARRASFINGSIEAPPCRAEAFDLITAFDVLEHVPHPEVALPALARLLHPQGISVISVPIESPVLRIIRYTVLLGGHRGNIRPHWEGTFHNLAEFETAWYRHFTPVEIFNTPMRWGPRLMNYDVVFVGRART